MNRQRTLGILAHQWNPLPGGGWRLVIFADNGDIGRLTIVGDAHTSTPVIHADVTAERLLHLVPADELTRRVGGGRR